jgi:hypothetical protein
MWRWDQSAGTLSRNGQLISKGYSGSGRGWNNPVMQAVPAVGPVPRGRWTIGAPYDSPNTGPYTLALTPAPGTDTAGRSAFRIHGDNRLMNNTASHGCIILPRPIRERIWRSGDTDLDVVE